MDGRDIQSADILGLCHIQIDPNRKEKPPKTELGETPFNRTCTRSVLGFEGVLFG